MAAIHTNTPRRGQTEDVSCIAHHTNEHKGDESPFPPCISSILPLFREHSKSASMQCHIIDMAIAKT
ncbi:MAG: hypothetical protein JJV94_07875 [Sulfurospirillum sp.]|nr:hypothetical protein [Sulfurospirillum sp.]